MLTDSGSPCRLSWIKKEMDDPDDVAASPVQHVYQFAALERLQAGATSLEVRPRVVTPGGSIDTGVSPAAGAILRGEHINCTFARQARGTGANAHSQPNEQFNYIVRGTMMSDIEGDRVFAARGTILHTPRGVVHTGLACPDEELVYLTLEATCAGTEPAPLPAPDYDGLNAFAGFGSRSEEPRETLTQVLEASERLPPGPGKRYVYEMHTDTDTWQGPASADVVRDRDLRLPPGVRGKLLSGEHLHVGVFRFDPGATLNNYRRDNEQLVFVVEGELDVDLGDEHVTVAKHCILHVPPGTRHELYAAEGAIVLITQDRRQQS